jgi:hypothetical protein
MSFWGACMAKKRTKTKLIKSGKRKGPTKRKAVAKRKPATKRKTATKTRMQPRGALFPSPGPLRPPPDPGSFPPPIDTTPTKPWPDKPGGGGDVFDPGDRRKK